MSMERMLDDEIKDLFEELKKTKPETEEYESIANNLTKLMDRSIELKKAKSDEKNQNICRDNDVELKLIQMKDEKRDRMIKNIITASNYGAIIVISVWGTLISMAYEREDTLTYTAGKRHLNKLLNLFK